MEKASVEGIAGTGCIRSTNMNGLNAENFSILNCNAAIAPKLDYRHANPLRQFPCGSLHGLLGNLPANLR
jgi:hypothetical protein